MEKMAPEESLYVVFSRNAGEKAGFWYEDSWGLCGCMSLHRMWGKDLGKDLTVAVDADRA
jgi:hypothetical protein